MARLFKKAALGSGAALVVGSVLIAGGCSGQTTTPDGGNPDGNVMGDTSVADTGADTKKDINAPDNQPMCPTPTKVTNFMPPAFHTPNAVVNVCTTGNGGQIQTYWDSCRAPQATPATCMTWKGANPTCLACLETQRTDMTWGPLVLGNGITFINISGCLELKGAAQCARDYQAVQFCDYAACDPLCKVTDFFASDHTQTLTEWNTCTTTANAGDCASFATKANCASMGAAGAICENPNIMSFQDFYLLYAPMFCSGGG